MPSCPSQGAVACQIAHPKVPLRAYISHRKVPLCGILPNTWCHRVQNLLCQGAMVWLCCQLRGAIGGYRMVSPCAKFTISWCHCVATLPIAWCHRRLSHGSLTYQVSHLMAPSCAHVPMSRCHRVPRFPMSRCHRAPLLPIACAPRCTQSCPSHGVPPLCQGRLTHDTCVCKVAYLRASSYAKVAHVKLLYWFPITRVPIMCKVSHLGVPSHANLPISRCPRVPMLPIACLCFPTRGAIA